MNLACTLNSDCISENDPFKMQLHFTVFKHNYYLLIPSLGGTSLLPHLTFILVSHKCSSLVLLQGYRNSMIHKEYILVFCVTVFISYYVNISSFSPLFSAYSSMGFFFPHPISCHRNSSTLIKLTQSLPPYKYKWLILTCERLPSAPS